ncbi:WD40/YVTN/BNR-like repeat-containing protein [Pseudomonas fluorescens]|uniref:BNR domain-containing protein n=1 Tax=Pseudomonas fluorescens TaxID=294 RepID=A0A944DIM0_PSEFL|nr:YCF48-related protein [Pseudomonas fluorescens]MBT2297400.1 BNR domain-containing protein [Pseudomonas fluorescens]MBT2305598.1 BNR domain-containing protein [Pseudomonas fluorescens]MBT2314379.1 BNR domain-containing protein [Pseudomonas fluorescens]MBT2319129.1 BNR domain-containing protein [Pseudomonas fluorescens]MBT2328598.1 BNR domain-containing protein [Pseudomonas fluorescens]
MNRISQAGFLLLALYLPFATSECLAGPGAVGAPLDTPAMLVPAAQKSVLLDLARAGTRVVAVGERGLVLLSDDNGQSWRQASVPVSVSLTAVQFVDARNGWAIGHAGVVLATRDGGESWTLQLDGVRAARLELDTAKADQATAANPDDALARVQSAERLVADGADKPFLALEFIDAQHGLIVGAYGLALWTADGGATWQSRMGHIANPNGMHLYAISHQGTRWFLAGEQGYLARSNDDAMSFKQLESPYEGSFFTLQSRADGALLVGGLRGNTFISNDGGDSFQRLSVPMPISFNDATRLADGRVLLVNQSGVVFRNGEQTGAALLPLGKPLGRPVSSLVEAADGSLIVAGFTGLQRIAQPSTAASE